MKRAAILGFSVLLAIAGLPSAQAADPTPLPSASSLALKDGRTLHNVKVMEDEGLSVVVSSDEGLLKLNKNLLPAGFVEPATVGPTNGSNQMVMEAFNPNLTPEPPPVAAKKLVPAQKPVTPGKAPSLVYRGCSIITFQPKTFGSMMGCAEVVIRNDSDTPVILTPKDLVCQTVMGQRLGGRAMIADGIPPVTKRKEVVPAHGQIDDIIIFANEALEFTGVQWAH